MKNKLHHFWFSLCLQRCLPFVRSISVFGLLRVDSDYIDVSATIKNESSARPVSLALKHALMKEVKDDDPSDHPINTILDFENPVLVFVISRQLTSCCQSCSSYCYS